MRERRMKGTPESLDPLELALLLEAAEGLSGLDSAERELIDEPADNEDDKEQ
jgi:hypothetical protein